MSRVLKIRFLGEAEGNGQARSMLREAGDTVLDRRGVPRSIVMRCPDGCGATLTVNLDSRSGKAWKLHIRKGQVTLYPSVWRDDGCKAHFIVWRDQILWADRHDGPSWDDSVLKEQVLDQLLAKPGQFHHFEAIAEALAAVPWEVNWACHLLIREGRAQARDRVFFRATSGTPVKPKGAA